MDLIKKLQRRGTGFMLEPELERAYESMMIERFKVQLYTITEEDKPVTCYKIMVELKDSEQWWTLASRRLPDVPREFRDYNTVIRHIQNRYPETESVQLSLKPE